MNIFISGSCPKAVDEAVLKRRPGKYKRLISYHYQQREIEFLKELKKTYKTMKEETKK